MLRIQEEQDAVYARLVGTVGRSLKAAGRRPGPLDAILHPPIAGDIDPEASVLGQIAVDSVDMPDLEASREAMAKVVAYWRHHVDEAMTSGAWDALAAAAEQLAWNASCLSDLERFIQDPLSLCAIVCETLPEFELVEID